MGVQHRTSRIDAAMDKVIAAKKRAEAEGYHIRRVVIDGARLELEFDEAGAVQSGPSPDLIDWRKK